MTNKGLDELRKQADKQTTSIEGYIAVLTALITAKAIENATYLIAEKLDTIAAKMEHMQ